MFQAFVQRGGRLLPRGAGRLESTYRLMAWALADLAVEAPAGPVLSFHRPVSVVDEVTGEPRIVRVPRRAQIARAIVRALELAALTHDPAGRPYVPTIDAVRMVLQRERF